MINSDVIVVGGGPAGSTCAGELGKYGIHAIILDKRTFPRQKVCAGWITPNIVKALHLKEKYPRGLFPINQMTIHIYGKKFTVKAAQYSIRRYEFDDWLLQRTKIPVYEHEVRHIRKEDDHYIVDDKFQCKYLVGAGGTNCPVYKTFFREVNPRLQRQLVVAMEDEFEYDNRNTQCHLWFFEKKLKGYSWYVPKENGYVNVGIGGKLYTMRERGETIRDHWNHFIEKLEEVSLVKNRKLNPKGYNYYLRKNIEVGQLDRAFIIGDAAGLATSDLGEGIGPAIKSGQLAANAIISGRHYKPKSIGKYSLGFALGHLHSLGTRLMT